MKQRDRKTQTILQSQVCLLCLIAAFDAMVQARTDYTRFSHLTREHKSECSSCHKFPSSNWKLVRPGSDAFPDISEYPDHQSCIGCHRRQFFARERPAPRICSNCHVKASPRDTSRFPFPSLGEAFFASLKSKDFVSDFRVVFPHDKHETSEPDSCPACHETYKPQGESDQEFVTAPPKNHGDGFWLKKGTFKTFPLTHSSCFTCHNQESEVAPLPQHCNSCHKPMSAYQVDFDRKLAQQMGFDDPIALGVWRKRSSSGTFRHEVHAETACTQCHVNAPANAAGVRKVPVKSCGGAEGCHITATADDGGVLNYELDQKKTNAQFVCVKCHLVFGTRPVPVSHVTALPKPATQ